MNSDRDDHDAHCQTCRGAQESSPPVAGLSQPEQDEQSHEYDDKSASKRHRDVV
jgi:hypothetical protein